MFDRAIENSLGAPCTCSHTSGITHFSHSEQMYDAVVQQIALCVVRQDFSAQVHHSDVSGQSGFNSRMARSTGYEPNVGLDESGTVLMFTADGDDEDLMGIENYQLGEAPPLITLDDHVVQTGRRDPGAVCRAAQRQAVDGEVPIFPQGLLHNTRHSMHDVVDYWRNQGNAALHLKWEQFENAAQENQRVAREGVQNAAVLSTSRTAAQMTSMFRVIENNAEANFSQQQRGLLSEVTSESAQALKAHRHTQIYGATAEMMRRDTRAED